MTSSSNTKISNEQIAHDLALFRLNKLDAKRVQSIGDVYKEYLEGVDMFRILIRDVEKGEIKL